MQATTLPIAVPVSRPTARRLADALRDAWRAWRRRHDERRTLERLLQLDAHTLRDIGASNALRAHAEARQSGAYERLADLLR
jgi:uncharacterized protein YjiS (DUF1127 family)